jgi:hypothetical protein
MKDWMLDHISKNHMISHGSLWRDFCFSKQKGSDKDFYVSISELKESEKIVEIKKDFNTFYDLGKQYKRDKLINKLLC